MPRPRSHLPARSAMRKTLLGKTLDEALGLAHGWEVEVLYPEWATYLPDPRPRNHLVVQLDSDARTVKDVY